MNKKMITVIALLLAVVITGYSVSGTYAKYATQLSATSDQARVARWDFKIGDTEEPTGTTVNLNLFKSSYECTTSTGQNCVQALTSSKGTEKGTPDSTAKIIAPGTSGKAEIHLSVDAETAFTLAFSMGSGNGNKVTLDSTEVDSALNGLSNKSDVIEALQNKLILDGEKNYSPVRFKVSAGSSSGSSEKIENFEYSKFAEQLNALITQLSNNQAFKESYFIVKGESVVTSGSKPVFKPVSKKEFAVPITVEWSWAYEYTGSEYSNKNIDADTIKKAVNLLDTALAQKAEKTIDFNVVVDAEQYSETAA